MDKVLSLLSLQQQNQNSINPFTIIKNKQMNTIKYELNHKHYNVCGCMRVLRIERPKEK